MFLPSSSDTGPGNPAISERRDRRPGDQISEQRNPVIQMAGFFFAIPSIDPAKSGTYWFPFPNVRSLLGNRLKNSL